MNSGVSVIICCYNSSQKLNGTLQHLANQIIDKHIGYEILLIDNNSSDYTSLVAKEIWVSLNSTIPFRIIREPMAGLSFARNTGVRHARFNVIIFCDDDNWLNEHYVQRSLEIMSTNLKIGALGGWSETTLPIEKLPSWFKDYQIGYAVGKQASKSGDVAKNGWLWGAGLVIRKELFLKAFSRFGSLLTDRKGELLISHGDVEICKRIILLGYNLYFSDQLFFRHDISGNRLTETYREDLAKGSEIGKEIIYLYDKQIKIKSLTVSKKALIILGVILRLLKKIIVQLSFKNLKWEVETIFMYTGVRLGKINKNIFIIKKI